MNRSRWRYAVTALPVMALALTGCGGGSGGSQAESDHKLTIWMMTGGPGDNPLIKEVNTEFAKKHPDIKVDIQIQQ